MDGGFLGGGGAGVEAPGPSDQGGADGPSRECPCPVLGGKWAALCTSVVILSLMIFTICFQ